ncbi:MAG: helix-turn-helix transcriptional regulator [Proteobacteria bacterium]|nr:helix-turn-helix transcriptional regulator [Pseudomonadota bacterium]
MDVEFSAEKAVARIAAAIGEPARARILYCLLDGHARTSTELAIVAEVSPSTASVHLTHLKDRGLVRVLAQGKHRYYSLDGAHTAAALEALMVVAVGPDNRFAPNTPLRLRAARTCYDHLAGAIAVALRDRFEQLGWLIPTPVATSAKRSGGSRTRSGETALAYDITPEGERALASLGIDITATRALRRRFAYGCVDWSERKPHIGGALGAELLKVALARKWVSQDLDSRALQVTRSGQRELQRHFGVRL